MRHLITLIVSLIILFVAVGCSGDDTSDLSTTTSTTAAAPTTSTTAAAPTTPTTTAPSDQEPIGAADDESDPPDQGSTGGDTAFPTAKYGWTPECVAALVTFFRIAEPAVSAIDWSTATSFEVAAINEQFAAESDAFAAQIASRGCTTELLSTPDGLAFVRDLAAANAPGMVDYLDFTAEREAPAG